MRFVAVDGGGGVTADASGRFREPAEKLGAVGDFSLCLREWLAHLGCHDGGELIGAAEDDLVCLAEDVGTEARRGSPPCRLGRPGDFDGPLGILWRPIGDVGDGLARRRVLDRELLLRGRGCPLTGYEQIRL
jgi:hypothetical protein